MLLLLSTMTLSASAESLSKALKRIERQTATNLTHAADTVANVTRSNVKPGVVYAITPAVLDDSIVLEALKTEIIKEAPGSTVVPLPNMIRVADVSGAILDLKPFALAGRALQFDEATRTFNASVKVGLQVINGGAQQKKLSAPIIFEVLDARAEDAIAKVDTTGPPYTEIKLEFASPPNPAAVRVASEVAPEGVRVPLATSSSIEVHAQLESVEGYGLEKTLVTVFVQGVEKLAGHPVVLSAPYGTFDKANYVTDALGMITAELTSESTGDIIISATVPGVGRGADGVTFTFPQRTFICSLAGGIAGGLIRLLQKRTHSVRRFLTGLLVAVLAGIVIFALYVVGVNVTPIQPTVSQSSMLVFVLSAIGAFLGNLSFLTSKNPAKSVESNKLLRDIG